MSRMWTRLPQEAMPHVADCGKNAQMFVSILIGFGIGMVLLSPMQEPAINMAIAPIGTSIGAHEGSMRAHARIAPVQRLAFANTQKQPLDAFRQRGLRAYTRPIVVRAESELIKKLDDAIKVAQECDENDEDCAVMWDDVEELSAAVAHGEPKALKSETLQVSDADLEAFKASMEKLAEARKKMPPESKLTKKQIDPAVMAEIESALAAKKDIMNKVATDRLTRFEAKIQEAIAAATASKSPVDWDIVEELMQERSHLKKFGGSS